MSNNVINDNIVNCDIQYKLKYLKYKFKYLKLKKIIDNNNKINDREGGGTWDTFAKSALSFVKSNPKLTSGIAGTVASGVQNIPNSSFDLDNIMISGFKTYLMHLPQYQQLVKSGLMTPQNEAMMFELIKLELSHLTDPSFYPIMFDLIKNIIICSAKTVNPLMVLSALKNLYDILNVMKTKYPKDFIILSTFFKNNKKKIFDAIKSKGIGYPGMEMQLNIFMKLIEPTQSQITSQITS